MKQCLIVAAALSFVQPASVFAADEIKEIDLKAAGFRPTGRPMTRPNMPTEIKTAEDLAKTFAQEEVVAAIKKEVNFDKQKLLYFTWAGSGQDKIRGEMVKDEAVFTYQRGFTRDLRSHYRLFAIPKNAKFKVEIGKFGK